MIISALKETNNEEKRVAIVPDVAKKLVNDGHTVLIEKDAGTSSFFSNEAYIEAGAEISSSDDIILKSDILLVVNLPSDEILSEIRQAFINDGNKRLINGKISYEATIYRVSALA